MSLILGSVDALVFAGIGALLQELLHWYGLRHQLREAAYSSLLRSKAYWFITIAVILVTPIAVVVWFSERTEALSPGDFLILGAAFPTLFKTVVARIGESGDTKLGHVDGGTESVRRHGVGERRAVREPSPLRVYLKGR